MSNTMLRVRVKNDNYDKRHLYGCYINQFNEYEGIVVPNPKWLSADSFCLTTGDKQFPFRIICKENIIHGWLYG